MNDKELLLDLLETLDFMLRPAVQDLPADALGWRPDPEANSIGVTMWHIGRLLDHLWAQALRDQPDEDQIWFANGWADRTAHDPRGLGSFGWGILAGYSQEEVAQVPALSASELITYLDQARDALRETLQSFPEEALHRRAPGRPWERWTAYRCVKLFVLNAFEHVGEIKALRAMWEREFGSAGPMVFDWETYP